MGYSCPVCEFPQADGRHLANHLAFTALLREGDHEAWLDEYVPDWESMDDDGLAAVVTEHAEEGEYPQLFEDTTGQHAHENHRHHTSESSHAGQSGAHEPDGIPRVNLPDDDELTAEATEVIERARELTRQRRDDTEESTATEETENT